MDITPQPGGKTCSGYSKKEGIAVTIETEKDCLYHPNTARIELNGGGTSTEIVGVSLGGVLYLLKIFGFSVDISGRYNTILCYYPEQVGMVARVTQI